jgi:hypothetical protein
MTMSLEEGLAAPLRVIKAYLNAEMVEEGLLEDVETLNIGFESDTPIEFPSVWIGEEPTVVDEAGNPNLSQTMFLRTPFTFACAVYENDPEQAEYQAKNLATRVGASILKHFNQLKSQPTDPDRIFQTIRFNAVNPNGEVQIEGKRDRIPCVAIVFDFVYPVRWLYCNRV